MILVTGGAGFIGANFVLDWLAAGGEPVVNLDKLTYAGNLGNLEGLERDDRHEFVRGDIGDRALIESLLAQHRPRAIVNFAAESHVDRSIHGPAEFIETNVVGTFTLLDATRGWWSALPPAEREAFRFLHVSTDEVYGSLGPADPAVHRDHGLRAEQPVLGVEGGVRPPGARLPPHLRPAGADDQLLEQLRAAAVPREAHPADDRQRARRQAAAGLRRRPERARLALRRRPLHGDPHGARRRAARRDLQHRRQRRDEEPRRRAHALRDPRRARARAAITRRSSPSSRIGPATTGATRSTRARSAASSAGRPPRPSRRACAGPCSGISTTPAGWTR